MIVLIKNERIHSKVGLLVISESIYKGVLKLLINDLERFFLQDYGSRRDDS